MHPKIKVKFLNIIILTSLLFCCKPKNEVEEFKIFPIKPYYFEKIENNNFRNFSTKIKYFMIETNITDTSTLGLKLDTFIKDYGTWSKAKTIKYMEDTFQNDEQYNILPTSTHDEQVTGFLRFMQDKDLGIELFEGNKSDFGGWKKLSLQSNGGNNYSFTSTPCP